MKSEKGITLTSLMVYVIAMLVVVGTITIITKYFYGNIDNLTDRNEEAKNYTRFNSYFTNEINNQENTVLYVSEDQKVIVFSNGNQYTFQDGQNGQDGGIYMNKIKICSDVTSCTFGYNNDKQVTANIKINGKDYNNVYTLKGK